MLLEHKHFFRADDVLSEAIEKGRKEEKRTKSDYIRLKLEEILGIKRG